MLLLDGYGCFQTTVLPSMRTAAVSCSTRGDYYDVTAQNGEFQRRIYRKRAIFHPTKECTQLSK